MSKEDKSNQDKYFENLLKQDASTVSQGKGEDPYALEQFGTVKKEGRLTAKYNRIKTTLIGNEGLGFKFVNGFKMGFIVGGIFGSMMGCIFAYKTGNLLYLPLSGLSSGASFGFFLGVGTVVRSEDKELILEIPLERMWWQDNYCIENEES